MKSVWAYMVQPLREDFFDNDGVVRKYKIYGFLHAWLDEKMQYQEEVKKTSRMPKLNILHSPKFKVTLDGRNSYRIESK